MIQPIQSAEEYVLVDLSESLAPWLMILDTFIPVNYSEVLAIQIYNGKAALATFMEVLGNDLAKRNVKGEMSIEELEYTLGDLIQDNLIHPIETYGMSLGLDVVEIVEVYVQPMLPDTPRLNAVLKIRRVPLPANVGV